MMKADLEVDHPEIMNGGSCLPPVEDRKGESSTERDRPRRKADIPVVQSDVRFRG